MEIIIWLVHEGISFTIHYLFNFIEVSNFNDRITISYYLQIFVNISCIFIFRKYLFHFSVQNVFTKKNLRICLWEVIAGIGVCLAHRLIFILFPQIGLSLLSQVSEEYIVSLNNTWYSPAIFIYTILLAPITEEFLLRGIIFHIAHIRYGNAYAVILSALLFALSHHNLMQFISAFCMGVVIGYFIVLTDNMYAGIMIHIANNTFSLISSNIMEKMGIEMSYANMIILSVSGIFILGLGILIMKYETGKLRRQKCEEKER